MNSSVDFAKRESRRFERWAARLCRGSVGKSLILLGVVGFALAVVLLVAPALASTFSDIDPNDVADYPEAVSILSNLGVIGGFPDGTFRPHDPVTRQQFAKMIVKLLGLPVTGSEVCPFVDVLKGTSASDPFYPDKYVAVCAANGITTGKTGTLFGPYDNISRAQLLSMVVRGAMQTNSPLEEPGPAYYAGTYDGTNFFGTWEDPYHAQNARRAEYNHLLKGIVSDFAVGVYGNATRGEVAQILLRLWQRIGQPTTTTTVPGPTTTTVPGSTLLYHDDFSSSASGWPVGSFGGVNGRVKYENGAYVMELSAPFVQGEVAGPSGNFADCRVVVDVTLTGSDACCGLLVRRASWSGFYCFGINYDRESCLYRWDEDGQEYIADWTYSSAIKPAGQANHLEITMSGNTFTGKVNGTTVFTGVDSGVPSGSVGFFIESGFGSSKAVFDNLEVWSK